MMILKEPIQLKARSPIRRPYQSFSQRILQNYSLLAAPLEPEDLLHLVSLPPEIYLGEGGITALFSAGDVENRQEWKLDIISNVMNRILLLDKGKLTYQDITYIGGVLKKLGIRNEHKFMKQLSQLQNEIRNTNKLIDLYWNYAEELREVITEVKSGEKSFAAAGEEAEGAGGQNRYYLQESIYRRLKTAAIYQLLQSFYQYQAAQTAQVSQAEMRIAEQGRLSRRMLLQKLKNVTLNNNDALLYHHINIYEMGEEMPQRPVTERTVTEEMAAAVFLGLAENLYELRAQQLQEKEERWYELSNAFYLSAGNILHRYESYHRALVLTSDASRNYLSQVNRHTREEISLLQNFVENTLPLYYMRAEETEEPETVRMQEGTVIPRQADAVYYEGDSQTDIRINPVYREEYRNQTETEFSWTDGRQFSSLEEQTAYYEMKNRQIREALLSMEETLPRAGEVKVDRERARKDSIRALEEPEALIREYMTQENRMQQLTQRVESQYEGLFSEETRAIFERLAQYRISPEEAVKNGIITRDAEGLLRAELAEAEKVLLEHPDGMAPGRGIPGGGEETELLAEHISERIYRSLQEGRAGAETGGRDERPGRMRAGVMDERGKQEALRFLQAAQEQPAFYEMLPVPDEEKQAGKETGQQEKNGLNYLARRVEERYESLLPQETRTVLEYLAQQEKTPEEAAEAGIITRETQQRLQKELINAGRALLHSPEDRKVNALSAGEEMGETAVSRIVEQIFRNMRDGRALPVMGSISGLLTKGGGEVGDVVYGREILHYLQEAGAQLIYQEGFMAEMPDAERIREVINNVERTSRFYREESREERLVQINMIHKQLEQELDEETVQEIIRLNAGRHMIQAEEAAKVQEAVKKAAVTNVSQDELRRTTENIEELVQKGVRREMGAISEQVYRKLERRLKNEQSRRGY